MPWAASTLYLDDTPAARAVLAAADPLRGHVFALDLAAVPHGPDLAEGASGRLLAVRSPGRPRDLATLVHGFDWAGLDGTLAPRLAATRRHLPGPAARIAPPDAQLRWMEDLAARVAGTVCWYQAEAPEGEPDAELTWVIDGLRPDELRFGAVIERVARAPAVYVRAGRGFLRADPAGAAPHSLDPLAMALLHLGARLDSPWFAPHAPGFDWEATRLDG